MSHVTVTTTEDNKKVAFFSGSLSLSFVAPFSPLSDCSSHTDVEMELPSQKTAAWSPFFRSVVFVY
jgi:hypothetical protein